MSGVGKGVASSSIGKILQGKGFKVTAVKIDPYINVDAGTMNPTEHGEVFVTEDGDETDQDIGNYERFLNIDILSDNYMTTGRVYQTVINKERNLEYKGKCVEVVPHIPEEVIRRIKLAGKNAKADFVIIEIGGTVGEYQNILFLEAARMMHLRHPNQVAFVLVSYLPVPSKVGEMKTKPTQYAVITLNSTGIQPDFILCRSDREVDEPRRLKIATFCNIDKNNIISAPDVSNIYEIPINLEKENLGAKILKKFNLNNRKKDLKDWKKFVNIASDKSLKKVKIGIVGKYFNTGDFVLSDSYLSVIEAVKHASWGLNTQPEILWIDAGQFEDKGMTEKKVSSILKDIDGIIVPGGFGSRGIEGKIRVIKYCRQNKIPYFGICYGMQLAVIEFARNVCGIKKANTREIDGNGKSLVIDIMDNQKKNLMDKNYGGTMRLGVYQCVLKNDTISRKAYGERKILERHRHRYEFNNEYKALFENKGLVLAGASPDESLVEIIELSAEKHPFFVGVQFHPEFKSRPLNPHPLFKAFIKASLKCN